MKIISIQIFIVIFSITTGIIFSTYNQLFVMYIESILNVQIRKKFYVNYYSIQINFVSILLSACLVTRAVINTLLLTNKDFIVRSSGSAWYIFINARTIFLFFYFTIIDLIPSVIFIKLYSPVNYARNFESNDKSPLCIL